MAQKTLNRREFIRLAATTAGGLVLAIYLDACKPSPDPTPTAQVTEEADTFEWSPNLYIKVDQHGLLTVTAFRSEMGQGIRTALAMLAAEELDIAWENVRIEQAPADSRYGSQQTGGSTSIATYYGIVRAAGAAARQMLVNAAAQAWGADPNGCTTQPGAVVHPDGAQKLPYGELVETAARLELARNAKTKDEDRFRLVGTGIHHWDAPRIVTGKAVYGLDVRLPGMLFAAVARCPVFGGKFSAYEDAPALAIPGVKHVVPLEDRIAVVADNSWAAIRGRDALAVTWDEGRHAGLSSSDLRDRAHQSLPQGNPNNKNTLEARYESPYEAHATMEPMNCTAYVHDGVCEVWAPTQSLQDVQKAVNRRTGLPTQVYLPLIGGGFGRRLQSDYAEEAAAVAQALNVPVQVVWTRADDLQHDFYQEMAVQHFSTQLNRLRLPSARRAGGSGVPTGAWRSVGEFTTAYGVQCFIDEMAAALGRDPLDLRQELYSSNQRALGVINLAAEKAGWGSPLPPGQGRGIAYHATFNVTHVCQVAEVSVDADGTVRVDRVVCAVDCGTVVNPDNVAAQMEGGIVFGLTAALKAEATIENGRVLQSNFHDYPILRMDEMPVVEVHIVESSARPSGIGEMGVPPIAPAVANAVHAATGVRVRHIPIRPADLKG